MKIDLMVEEALRKATPMKDCNCHACKGVKIEEWQDPAQLDPHCFDYIGESWSATIISYYDGEIVVFLKTDIPIGMVIPYTKYKVESVGEKSIAVEYGRDEEEYEKDFEKIAVDELSHFLIDQMHNYEAGYLENNPVKIGSVYQASFTANLPEKRIVPIYFVSETIQDIRLEYRLIKYIIDGECATKKQWYCDLELMKIIRND